MLLQAALNGSRDPGSHASVPTTPEALAADAVACAAAGASTFHIHPRGADGLQTLDPAAVDAAVLAIREATGLTVGVTTGAWIPPYPAGRLPLIAQWTAPDYASVNVNEDGAADLMRTLLDAGIGVEAGVWSVADVDLLAASGLADRCLRVMLELIDQPAEGAVAWADGMHAALDRHGIALPRLSHGNEASTWVLIEDAVTRGIDTRIGLEDVLTTPDGTPAAGNVDLVAAAAGLGAGTTR